ncbi:hypothetical protein PUNSTDRAFT_29854, partial [Punctularia strigosozonata HHB-11173 SS5]|uniref:uncharacterized protein n=1 Tax=Punctularia strigosozonata (strain HHB-11173) TaxID=741275 RepID=UPI0004417C7C
MDFVQNLDPSKLVLVETALSFLISPFASAPYNLPIFLFGTYAQENAEAAQSLRTFLGLVGGSALFDIIWMTRTSQSFLIKTVQIIVLVLKFPLFLTFASALRQRG